MTTKSCPRVFLLFGYGLPQEIAFSFRLSMLLNKESASRAVKLLADINHQTLTGWVILRKCWWLELANCAMCSVGDDLLGIAEGADKCRCIFHFGKFGLGVKAG